MKIDLRDLSTDLVAGLPSGLVSDVRWSFFCKERNGLNIAKDWKQTNKTYWQIQQKPNHEASSPVRAQSFFDE